MSAPRVGLALLGALVLAFGWNAATHAVDFPIYHQAGAQILRGDWEIYPPGLYSGTDVPSHGFRYAPALALLFAPMALLPLDVAAFLFYLVKVAAIVYVARVVARRFGILHRVTTLLLLSLLVVGGYLVEEMRYGNFHFLTVALMVAAFDGVERGRIAAPAVALAVAIASKVTPLLLLGYFALQRRVAVCVATVAALVVLLVAPAMVVGWTTNAHLLEGFARYAVQKTEEGRNHSLRGALVKHLTVTLDDSQYPGVTLAHLDARPVEMLWVAGVALAALASVVVLQRRPGSPPRTVTPRTAAGMLELSLVLTAMLLASPHTQRQHLTALYVPALVMLAMLLADRARTPRRLLLTGLVATSAASTILPLVFGGRRLALAYEAGSPYFVATVVLFVVLLALLTRVHSADPVADPAVQD